MFKRKHTKQAIADAARSLKEAEDRIKKLNRQSGDDFFYRIYREERIIKREKLYSLLIAS